METTPVLEHDTEVTVSVLGQRLRRCVISVCGIVLCIAVAVGVLVTTTGPVKQNLLGGQTTVAPTIAMQTTAPVLENPSLTVELIPATNVTRLRRFRVTEATRRGRCLLTQQGHDGFGHQLRGRLSLMMFSLLFPDHFLYLHTNFDRFDHSSLPGHRGEEFVNVAPLFPSWHDYVTDHPNLVMNNDDLRDIKTMLARVQSGQLTCSENVVYQGDNLWYFFEDPATQPLFLKRMEETLFLRQLRESYLATPKPELYFKPGRPNVVMHIRRTDNSWHQSPSIYYDAAIAFFEKYFRQTKNIKAPIFLTIETDDPHWSYVEDLLKTRGPDNAALGQDSEDMLSAFHRFVMADGFIMSDSSFSEAAVFFRDEGHIATLEKVTEKTSWSAGNIVYLDVRRRRLLRDASRPAE